MDILLRVGDIVTVDKKDKSYINCSGKSICVAILCLIDKFYKKVIWTLMVSYFMQN